MHEILFISQQGEFPKNETMIQSVSQAYLGCGLRFSHKLLI
jgi:hypothetical protein